jgi:DNA-binding NtrC family response regulator
MTDDTVLEPRHFGAAAATAATAATATAAAGAARASAPAAGQGGGRPGGLLRPLHEQVGEVERAAIGAALAACGGNRVAAARLLGMSRAALYDRLARWPDLLAAR